MTYEEFQAGLAETPELLGTIMEKHESDAVKYLTDTKKMHVASTEEYASDRERAIGQGSKKAHEDWEASLADIVGETKPNGVKGIDWLKDLKEKKKLIKASMTGDPDSADNQAKDQAIKDLQKQINTLNTNLETEKKGVFTAKVNAEINSGIGSLKFRVPSDVKDDARAAYQRDQVAANKALFSNLYPTSEAMTDGKVLYKDVKGVAQVDANGDPLSVEGIFAKNHAHLLQPTGHKQGGTGSGSDSNPDATNPDYMGKTEGEISIKLAEKGLTKGSKAFREARIKALDAAGIKHTNGVVG